MKQTLINFFGLCYWLSGIITMSICLSLPLIFEMKDFSNWAYLSIPLTLLYIASVEEISKYLKQNNFMK